MFVLNALMLYVYVFALPVVLLLLIASQPQIVNTKYGVGDIVTYSRGSQAESLGLSQTVQAVVERVSTGHGGRTYAKPLYVVRWDSAWPHISPFGRATVYESSLSD